MHSISVHMSYLSYMTNHYQHARNDHANDTTATKYIQPYGNKKPSLKYATTENESSIRFHENILWVGPYKSSK
jgi:hypothetical protein